MITGVANGVVAPTAAGRGRAGGGRGLGDGGAMPPSVLASFNTFSRTSTSSLTGSAPSLLLPLPPSLPSCASFGCTKVE